MLQGIILLAFTACDGPDKSTPEDEVAEVAPPVDRTQFGWLSEVVLDPPVFAALMEEQGRDGWIALHAHDYRTAAEIFEAADPRARAELAQGLFYADLGRVSGLAHEQLFSEWDARGGLPANNETALLAALASFCSDSNTTVFWASRVTEEPGLALAKTLLSNRSAFDLSTSDTFGRRLAIHREARGGDEQALLDVASTPLISQEEEDFVREFWDPCLYQTLSEHWMQRFANSLGGSSWKAMIAWSVDDAPLAGRLFAPWSTVDDLAGEIQSWSDPGLVGARAPSLRKLGVGTDAMAGDDAEKAKAVVRVLDVGLSHWKEQLLELADDEGRALLQDLDLVHRFRQEWLITRARLALHDNLPRQALTFLQLGQDHAQGVGPANAPALLALTAEAHLRLGHTREALDALHQLSRDRPEILAVKEIVGDLTVLRGLDRQGDSKESQ